MNSGSTRHVEETTAKGRGSSGVQEPVLGLRQNLGQFSLLVLVNAFGALLSGIIADLLGIVWAITVVGVLTLASGLVVALRMTETLKRG